MSYILDALRKADAQRERDASRGIHAQTATLGTIEAAESGSRTGCFAMVAAAVVVIAGAAWYLTRSAEPTPTATAAPQPMAPAPAPATAPVAANAISPPAPPPAPAALQAREAAFTSKAAAPQVTPQLAAQPAAQASAPQSAPIAGGLPADAPKVAISGGVYSPNPAQRMLIVNGQVFNEGSEVAPGVKIEAIQARNAVLGFRGGRYTVAY
jgi:general secretion pathway protein B